MGWSGDVVESGELVLRRSSDGGPVWKSITEGGGGGGKRFSVCCAGCLRHRGWGPVENYTEAVRYGKEEFVVIGRPGLSETAENGPCVS